MSSLLGAPPISTGPRFGAGAGGVAATVGATVGARVTGVVGGAGAVASLFATMVLDGVRVGTPAHLEGVGYFNRSSTKSSCCQMK